MLFLVSLILVDPSLLYLYFFVGLFVCWVFFFFLSFSCLFPSVNLLDWRRIARRSTLTRCHPRREDIPAVADNALVAAVFVLPVGAGDGGVGAARSYAVRVHAAAGRLPQTTHRLVDTLLLLLRLLLLHYPC